MATENTNGMAFDYADRIVKQVLTAWDGQNKHADKFINKYDDAFYLNEVAPGKNRAIYLIGHLIAVNDDLLRILGLGERLYKDLDEAFIDNPDKAIQHIPSISELKEKWNNINKILNDHFSKMSVSDWMSRHMSVSEADFAKEPHRNKLNVLLTRTTHQAYHIGQLNLINGD